MAAALGTLPDRLGGASRADVEAVTEAVRADRPCCARARALLTADVHPVAWRIALSPGYRFDATQALRQVLARALVCGMIDANPVK